ncbi:MULTISPECIES: radical SAM family heme chaperone HemW [Psychroflexus]|uniref:Heme chaperone HemW n=1 Tax=Psychroflexus halocasei TaxID=908615 RepID=A0A1H4D2D4_9FLAO|nr:MULTISPECIES: radical SAM family heme chaperone HemW [Psychroflexus]PJX22757.1 coproporphyrinogen III oxidase [Psychroflexus sp. S27]SEA66915.1 oxygen-independent coproporphyrinogen-3 oxidase [Psychroflexus halocasei]
MSGIYIHIPFCKQACHYCDFHFSTSMKYKEQLVSSLMKEISLRRDEISPNIKTIYFGGGTPSLLNQDEVTKIINQIHKELNVDENAEITLEANPDDLDENYLKELSQTKVNRLSIGVQSFFEKDLKMMNRAHNSEEAHKSIQLAKKYFDNISIDLIYGIPEMSIQRWKENINKVFELNVPHISCYALTVEPQTALAKFIEKEIIKPVDDALAREHYEVLCEEMSANGFDNYEFSNFGKAGYYSQNNMAYWTGKSYLGIGPAAHSFDGKKRSWNINNNIKYIKAIESGKLPSEVETLTKSDRFNEYIMTGLRTKFGVSLQKIKNDFGQVFYDHIQREVSPLVEENHLELIDGFIHITPSSRFLTDGISSELFRII